MKDNLLPISKSTIEVYRNAKKENALNARYLEKWIKYKEKYFTNFLGYALDKEGNLYRRDFLFENEWNKVSEFKQSDLNGKF